MQTMTIEIANSTALKAIHALEVKHAIRIIENEAMDSPALHGTPLTLKAFKAWVNNSEQSPSTDLNEAKKKWAAKRKQLQKLTR